MVGDIRNVPDRYAGTGSRCEQRLDVCVGVGRDRIVLDRAALDGHSCCPCAVWCQCRVGSDIYLLRNSGYEREKCEGIHTDLMQMWWWREGKMKRAEELDVE